MKLKQEEYEYEAISAGLDINELSIHYQHNRTWIIWYKDIAEKIVLNTTDSIENIGVEFRRVFDYLYQLDKILENEK